jgi:hypothetical protein
MNHGLFLSYSALDFSFWEKVAAICTWLWSMTHTARNWCLPKIMSVKYKQKLVRLLSKKYLDKTTGLRWNLINLNFQGTELNHTKIPDSRKLWDNDAALFTIARLLMNGLRNVVFMHNGILLNHKEEWNFVICR